MAKCIKRAGIVFFVIVLSLLIAVGVLITAMDNKNENNYFSQSVIADSEDEEFVTDYILSGNVTQMAEIWEQAVLDSIDNQKEIKVSLGNNWILTAANDNRFGEETSFYDGALYVPIAAKIVLDLAGKTIDRGLSSENPIECGNVFVVDGILTITDSTYNNSIVKDIYDYNKENFQSVYDNLRKLEIGKIMGGSVSGANSGGGIFVSETGILNIYGGMICGNFAKGESLKGAGGVYCYGGVVNFYDGVIFNNETIGCRGGGIATNTGTINMTNGYVIANINSVDWCGGISAVGSLVNTTIKYGILNITGGIISHNVASNGAGVAAIIYSKANIENVEIAYNYAQGNSAGVLLYQEFVEAEIKNSVIKNNFTGGTMGNPQGGAVYCEGKLKLSNVTITNNVYNTHTQQVIYGGGVFVRSKGTLEMENVTISDNIIKSAINDGVHSLGGGFGFETGATLKFGSNVKIYNNIAHGVPSDVRLEKGQTLPISVDMANEQGTSHIGIKLADDYGDETFTTGYSVNNSDPRRFFFSNASAEVAVLNNGEIKFEKTIDCLEYDFIYTENGLRKNYSDNQLIHDINDFEIIKANGNKYILGNISHNTSVNTFIENINFERTAIKIYNANNQLIFDKGNSIAGIDSALYDKRFELAVGTGWKIELFNANGVKTEEIYLSVLGDINGDGRLSAADIAYLRELAVEKSTFNSLIAEIQLACLIDNRGLFSLADAEILNVILSGESHINLYY